MSMPIYKLTVTEGAQWAIPADRSSWDLLNKLAVRGAPSAGDWTPFEVRLLGKEGGRSFTVTDCPWLTSHSLVLRPAAAEVFAKFSKGNAELLPLRCPDADLMLLNVWRSVDALDLSRSTFVKIPPSDQIIKVESHVFNDEVIEGHDMFRLSAMPLGGIYFHANVVDAAKNAGLRNVSFKLVSEPTRPDVGRPKTHESISMADMAATSDEDLWNVLYLALVPRVAGSRDEEYAIVKSWTKGLQMLWATQLLDDEVGNGGFNQYFFNDSGQFAIEAIDGFELIGAHERAELVRKAVDQLFHDAPRLRQFYEPRTMEAFIESYKHTDLGAIDEEWSNAPEFFTARTRHIREHPEEFVIPPT